MNHSGIAYGGMMDGERLTSPMRRLEYQCPYSDRFERLGYEWCEYYTPSNVLIGIWISGGMTFGDAVDLAAARATAAWPGN